METCPCYQSETDCGYNFERKHFDGLLTLAITLKGKHFDGLLVFHFIVTDVNLVIHLIQQSD